MTFDALKYVEALKGAGVPEAQATAQAAALAEALGHDLATKADIAELRLEMAELKAEIQAMLNRALGYPR